MENIINLIYAVVLLIIFLTVTILGISILNVKGIIVIMVAQFVVIRFLITGEGYGLSLLAIIAFLIGLFTGEYFPNQQKVCKELKQLLEDTACKDQEIDTLKKSLSLIDTVISKKRKNKK